MIQTYKQWKKKQTNKQKQKNGSDPFMKAV
jgi:hypothetical protein